MKEKDDWVCALAKGVPVIAVPPRSAKEVHGSAVDLLLGAALAEVNRTRSKYKPEDVEGATITETVHDDAYRSYVIMLGLKGRKSLARVQISVGCFPDTTIYEE